MHLLLVLLATQLTITVTRPTIRPIEELDEKQQTDDPSGDNPNCEATCSLSCIDDEKERCELRCDTHCHGIPEKVCEK